MIKKKHVKSVVTQLHPVSYNPPDGEFIGAVRSLCWNLYAQRDIDLKWLQQPDGSSGLVKDSSLVERTAEEARVLVLQHGDWEYWVKIRG